MKTSTRILIVILLVVGLPIILGAGIILANQLQTHSLADDYRLIQPVVIDNSVYNTSSRDAFEFLRVELDNDLLTIEISYSGGLKSHDFGLIGTGEFMESMPIQTRVALSHDSNGDLGEALLTKELNYDLKPLKELYFSIYSFTSPDDISLQINIEGYGGILYNL